MLADTCRGPWPTFRFLFRFLPDRLRKPFVDRCSGAGHGGFQTELNRKISASGLHLDLIIRLCWICCCFIATMPFCDQLLRDVRMRLFNRVIWSEFTNDCSLNAGRDILVVYCNSALITFPVEPGFDDGIQSICYVKLKSCNTREWIR